MSFKQKSWPTCTRENQSYESFQMLPLGKRVSHNTDLIPLSCDMLFLSVISYEENSFEIQEILVTRSIQELINPVCRGTTVYFSSFIDLGYLSQITFFSPLSLFVEEYEAILDITVCTIICITILVLFSCIKSR